MSQTSIDSLDNEDFKRRVMKSSSQIMKKSSSQGVRNKASRSSQEMAKSSFQSPSQEVKGSSSAFEEGGRKSSTGSGEEKQVSDSRASLEPGEKSCDRVVKTVISQILNEVYEEEKEKEIVEQMPSLAVDMVRAKAFLQKPSPKDGISLYDHLSALLNKILAEKPANVIDYFEEYSRNMKEERFHPLTDHLQDIYVPPDEYQQTKNLMPLFQVAVKKEAEEMAPEEEESTENPLPDMMELQYYFQQAGIGLPPSEMFLIHLSLHQLKRTQPFTKLRFWGKILGLVKDYIVAEAELTEEGYAGRNMELEGEPEVETQGEGKAEAPEDEAQGEGKVEAPEGEIGGGDAKFTPKAAIPMSTYKPPPEVPPEKSGEGVNKKVYFICNEPGDEWIALPDVTPLQIDVSRKIRRFFTGILDTEVATYPAFPGNEMNYLRAQIARISAGTQISPLGFYQFGEGEEEEMEEEEAEGKTEYVENPDFEPVPLQDLIDPSLAFWVHHSLAILKQGRTAFWNPKAKPQDEEEEEVEEEEEEKDVGEIEVGPPLLTPLSEDASLETTPPWTARQTSFLLPDTAVAIVRSNIWPGASAFASGKKFENIYIGYGLKEVPLNYSPPPMPPVQKEYPLGPEVMEINDPTAEEEEAWRIAHEKKIPEKVEGEEEGEEEEEGGEEEEEEDDEDDE